MHAWSGATAVSAPSPTTAMRAASSHSGPQQGPQERPVCEAQSGPPLADASDGGFNQQGAETCPTSPGSAVSSLIKPRLRVAVVLPAAGSGLRAGTPTAKQFWPVENNPLLFFTLSTLEAAECVDSIICPTTAGAFDSTLPMISMIMCLCKLAA